MNDCAIIILGATGDLARRKIFPALFQLYVKKKLGKSIIIGAALDELHDTQFHEKIKQHISIADQAQWSSFISRISYVPINFLQPTEFKKLAAWVAQKEKEVGLTGNRLAYCATAPYFYCSLSDNLASSNLIKRTKHEAIWQRIVFEKPFGSDLQSAQEINRCIAKHFDEHQIYRIDHYLTKELVGNIALIRFTNLIFEPLWNNRYIDQVQIIFDEQLDVDGRGAYYDKYGAVSDVMQNHMMQLVALIGMESPEKLTGDKIRSERARVLERVQVVDALFGQYEGYKKEMGVDPQSQTETFAQVMVRIDNPRWSGVPFYLKTGKCLDKKETVIFIKFKKVDCLLSRACPSESNFLTIRISPDPLFALTLNAKVPGTIDEVAPVEMDISHDAFVQQSTQAYEIVIEEVMRGEQSVAVRFDEIESAWRVIDAIRARKPVIFRYEKGTSGPKEAVKLFDEKHGVRWKA